MDYGNTIGLRVDQTSKYADVVSGDEDMTMLSYITGEKFGKVELPMIIIKNSSSSYLFRGVTEVQGVCYLSQPNN